MKLSCTQENLARGLSVASHIANKNTNLPILNNLLLQATDKTLKLCATNLEIGITCFTRCKILEEGEFAVEAKILSDYINLLPKNNIEVETKDTSLEVNCGNYNTQINGSQTDEFPLIPTVEKESGYKVKTRDLKEALSQIVFAASFNDLRQEISGSMFSFSGSEKVMTIVATDSYRLAEKKIDCEPIKNDNSDGGENSIILPLRTIQEILRILNLNDDFLDDNDDMGNVYLYFDDNQVLVANGNTEIVSKLIEGQYPDYGQIIPQDFKTNIVVNRAEFQKAIKTASLFTKAGIYDVELKVSIDTEEVEVFAENSQLGKNSTKIKTQVSGEDNSIVLNFRYLLDGLQNISSNEITIDIVDSATPCLVRPYENEKVDDRYLYLVMPIRQ